MKKIALISGTILGAAVAPQVLASGGGLMFMAQSVAYKATQVAFVGSASVLAVRAIQNRASATAAA